MASTTGDDYDNLNAPKPGTASSNLQSGFQLRTSYLHSSAASLPDLRQPTSTNALELPRNVIRNSSSLSQEAGALPLRLSYDTGPNFRPSQEYVTGTLNSIINESGSNTIGSLTRGGEVSCPARCSKSLGQQNLDDFVCILDI
jgi:hypothetical protein